MTPARLLPRPSARSARVLPAVSPAASRPVASLAAALPAVLAAALMLLAGCQSLVHENLPASIDRAQALVRSGDHAGAAREFEALAADNAGRPANDYLLRAATEWLAAGRASDASRVLALLAGELGAAQARDVKLIGAEAALLRGDAAQGWAALLAVPEPTDAPTAARYFVLRQRLAFATARPVEGVRAEIAAEKFLPDDAARLASRRELFAQLRAASERGEKLDPNAAAREPLVRGWLELAPIAAQAKRYGGAASAIAVWRARNAGHPAQDLLRSEVSVPEVVASLPSAPHVALLVPLTGRNAAAGVQIRDGLLAGLYGVPAAARPNLRLYDTNATSIAQATSDAAAAGADFIIGPLIREDVIAAAEIGGRRPRMLALNFLPADHAPPEGFYQFALSPEDEARAAARRAISDGHRRAAALVPAGDWGTRVLAAFREEFEAGGGVLLSSATLPQGRTDYAAPIQSLLRLADSRARAKRLEGVLGTALAFQARRRGDIDCIFTPAPASIARQVRPQLRFHFAGDLPDYATSDAFDPGSSNNRDLDGLVFLDMPWMLGTGDATARLRTATTQAWPQDPRSRSRLFAFGYDAWQLYTALRGVSGNGNGAQAAVDIAGVSGHLTLDANRRVRRELEWAGIRDGTARLLGAQSGQ
jgi:outer membrane PBP1 activator LpoA protein